MAPVKRKPKSATAKGAAAKRSSAKRSAAPARKPAASKAAAAEDYFKKAAIIRGDAAPLTASGELPKEASYVLETDERGEVTLRRERAKLV